MILETERLILSPATQADAPLIHPILADPEVMAHMDGAAMDDPDLVDAFVGGRVAEMANGEALYWSVRHNASGAYLGSVDLSDIDRRHHRAELGFVLGRDAWGHGYGHEAVHAVLSHAATQGFKRVWARTQVGDNPSERLLLKLGFEDEGYLRGHTDRDGERRDFRLWGLLL
ncbi:MAG: GNAT family N-acetyltransferase [Caulobacter sp.]|nr:GNAT family N-acetyltransferase [Caulobacter sp.]MDP1960822.1 GNAT family N-acetyltransferase [Reyranella sp.]